MKAKQTGLPQVDPFPIRSAYTLSLAMLDAHGYTLERLALEAEADEVPA